HDPQRRAVLHRGAGIHEFALAPDLAAGGRARALEQDERRIADQVERILANGRNHAGAVRAASPREQQIPPFPAQSKADRSSPLLFRGGGWGWWRCAPRHHPAATRLL